MHHQMSLALNKHQFTVLVPGFKSGSDCVVGCVDTSGNDECVAHADNYYDTRTSTEEERAEAPVLLMTPV